jgi:ketosteroid isomerase-like protein
MESTGVNAQAAETQRLEANKLVALEWLDAILNGNESRVTQLMADECVFYMLGSTAASGFQSRERWLEILRQGPVLMPGAATMHIGHITAEADRVAVEAESHLVTQAGKPYHNQYHFLLRVRDGKVSAFKEYFDTQETANVFQMPFSEHPAARVSNLESISHTIVRRL